MVAEERRCALIGYLDETVMRIREPLVLVQQNLADIAVRMDTIPNGADTVRGELQVEVDRLGRIVEILLDLQRAFAEERDDIPAPYREFIARQ